MFIHLISIEKYVFTQPLNMGSLWYKVNFLEEYIWFEFKVFFFLD